MFKIGCDPEIFVGDGNVVKSIIGKIGGSKQHPRPLELGQGFAVQEDNVALEFNVPPASTRVEFIQNVRSTMSFLNREFLQTQGLQFVNDSAVSFPEEELQNPAARMFGCDPDYNAWTKQRNPPPKADDPNLRACGGHVHVGLDRTWTDEKKRTLVKCMDLQISVPGVWMDKGIKRKQFYGKAGAHRIKPYGVEYRTPSNYWIWTPELIGWVYDSTERAIEMADYGIDIDADANCIVEAINNNNELLARELVNKYNLQVLYA